MGEITYMDCWQFIAPLIPANSNCAQEIYVKTFQALKEAEERRVGTPDKRQKDAGISEG